jgi:ribosome biogenesis GTPase
LSSWGWDDAWQAAYDAVAARDDGGTAARIVAEHRGAYHAASVGGGVAWCENTGHAYHVAGDKRALPAVGDWVVLDGWERALAGRGNAVIRAILPRRSLLVRRAAGEAVAPQPLAANVDVGIVMTSANTDLSPARLDRYLALLRDATVPARIVLSKADLVAGDAALGELAAPLAELAPVTSLSLVGAAARGLADIRAVVGAGRTAVLLGSSGVGKSSLLNALLGEAAQATREIRGDDRGRHTTTRRELFAAGDGSLWIDTPGMRELGQFIDDDEDEDTFDDIAELAQRCRFADCRHANEPGCAVASVVSADRIASFHKLTSERAVVAKDAHTAKRIAETRRAKAKRYAPRTGKPDKDE